MTAEFTKTTERHPSMRGWFAAEVYDAMAKDPRIVLVTGDLGYKVWDRVRTDFPDRFINTGAAEQAMMGIAVGLAMEGKIPIVYSITPFLLARPYETIRNYVNREMPNVKLIGSGRDRDYSHDGFSHWADDAGDMLKMFPNIVRIFPDSKEEIPDVVNEMLKDNRPWFVSLKR